jgi:hypothetical protein
MDRAVLSERPTTERESIGLVSPEAVALTANKTLSETFRSAHGQRVEDRPAISRA